MTVVIVIKSLIVSYKLNSLYGPAINAQTYSVQRTFDNAHSSGAARVGPTAKPLKKLPLMSICFVFEN